MDHTNDFSIVNECVEKLILVKKLLREVEETLDSYDHLTFEQLDSIIKGNSHIKTLARGIDGNSNTSTF